MMELLPEQTGILVIDFQQRLCGAMHPEAVERATRNVTHLLTLAEHLNIKVIATEQYPKGLGPTLTRIGERLPQTPIPKTAFSALRDVDAAAAIAHSERRQWILVGMETHICVYQTARDLSRQGMDVIVPGDAVLSRTDENRDMGLSLIAECGGLISATEAVLFDLLKEAGGAAFKEISRLIR